MAGETVKCVRIRNKGARAATAAEQLLDGVDTDPLGLGSIDDGAGESQAH
jgi:hypothetical protein